MNNRGHFRGRTSGGRNRNGGSSFNLTVNSNLDSTGPCGKVRGNALQLVERYLAAAKDAKASDDRVLEESCLQHAEHYWRMNCSLVEIENNKKEQALASAVATVPSATLSVAETDDTVSDSTSISTLDASIDLADTEEDKVEADTDVLSNVVNMDLSLPDLNTPKRTSSRKQLSLKKASSDN